MTDAIHHTGIIGLMRGRDAFENRRFEGGGFIELLPFEHAQSFTDDIGFVGIASGVNKPIHKLIQRGRKGNCHKQKVIHSGILSRLGLCWVSLRTPVPWYWVVPA